MQFSCPLSPMRPKLLRSSTMSLLSLTWIALRRST